MPIPQSDRAQELLSTELSTFPEEIAPKIANEPMFGNRFAYFEFSNPQGGQIIRHRFRIRTWELRWQLDPTRAQPVTQWPDSFAPYRRSESQAVVADARFEKLLAEIVPQRRSPLQDLHSVMSWVDGHFTYDHARASLKASSVHGLEQLGGNCGDYHGFCAAMGRLLGYPTRVTYGISAFPKASPSHCKLEAFLPPYGWVSFDVSETQKLMNAIRANESLTDTERTTLIAAAKRRLVTGFRDNTYFAQTRGTEYELVPMASSRVSVVRTIYAEADGKPLPDPDPSNPEQTTFSWMTAHRFTPDRAVKYPFTDLDSLREWATPISESR
jgi:transglutaminase-like putative cysteine protease